MLILLAVHAAVAAVLPLLARRLGRAVWPLAALVPLAAVGWALAQAPRVIGGSFVQEDLTWAPSLGLRVDLRLDALALLMVCVLSGVGAAVLVYCAYYVEQDAGREAALLLAFAGAMLGLVLADNLFVLYAFWELTSVASFLLIAGRSPGRRRRAAAAQALLTTVAGGLAMLLGLVILAQAAGTVRLSALLADPPRGGLVSVALALVLVGAFAKSAQMPLHGWLPAAMVAPTPVSAYLHAAAMVKAGVYLIARLAPGFAEVGLWRPAVFTVGLLTMVLGAWRALRETDLKELLAYGTVSELGMLTVLLGAGTRTAALAGEVMLLAHASFKATLFLVVGILEHQAGTRDIRELSDMGRRLPGVFAVAALAAASMAGLPPLIDYLGKEAAYEAFQHGAGSGWVLAGLFLGFVLTVAYSARFLWGAFARKPGREPTAANRPAFGFLAPVAVLSLAGLVLGVWYRGTDALASAYADVYRPGEGGRYTLALWHGWTPTLVLSVLTVAAGAVLHLGREQGARLARRLPRPPDAQHGYGQALHGVDRTASWVTRHTQVGSLPVYLTVLLMTVLAVPGTALVAAGVPVASTPVWASPVQLPLAVVVLTAAVAVSLARRRLTGVLLVGAVGYGVAGLFLVHGAPDLALTQFLVESLTLVVVALVLRRLPARFTAEQRTGWNQWLRLAVAVATGAFAALFALSAASVRHPPPVSDQYLERAPETGAYNAVNAIIVDFRALDTLGEISVLLVAAIGGASLVGLWRINRKDGAPHAARPSPAAHWDEPREQWLPGAGSRPGAERSLLLEVVTRVLFPSVLVLSVYLLFAGHYRPGGGFAGGLVAGQALVLRYLVGGQADLGFAAPVEPGVLAGGGLALAAVYGAVPMAFGAAPLSSTVVGIDLPVLGHLEFATSLFFDIGVYLLVIGVVLQLLAAVGTTLTASAAEPKDSTV